MTSGVDKVNVKELNGRRIDLDADRYVWVGTHKDYPGETGIVFRNSQHRITSFRLSGEALSALVDLLTNKTAGQPGYPPPPSSTEVAFEWRLVSEAEP